MSNDNIKVSVTRSEPVTTLEVSGDLDVKSSPVLVEFLTELTIRGNDRLDLDLERVRFLDSYGVRVLVRSFEEHRARRGRLRIVAASHAVERILSLLSLQHMLPDASRSCAEILDNF